MDEYISGIIKDISFHEMFMYKLRVHNTTQNHLFDPELAFRMIDSSSQNRVSAYEIQGFLDKHNYKFQTYICDQVITSLDKSNIGLTFQKFLDLVLQGSQQEKQNSLLRNNNPKLTLADYNHWDRVNAATKVALLDLLVKQAHFYSELQKRKRDFCKNWHGDIYKSLNYFDQKKHINYEDVYVFLKEKKILFNENEWKSLIRRTTSPLQMQRPQFLTKEELVQCLVTSRLKNKKDQLNKNSQLKSNYSYTKWLDKNYVLTQEPSSTRETLQETFYSPYLTRQMSYNFFYPEAQTHLSSSLFLIEQKNKIQVRNRLEKVNRHYDQYKIGSKFKF